MLDMPEFARSGFLDFGVPILRIRAEFTAIADIACGQNVRSPAIWIDRAQGGRLHLADFSSVDERDWVAEELRKLWRNATRK
jgi:hypothetical protein